MLHTAQYPPSPPPCLGLVILTFKGSEGSATGGPTFYSDIFEADPPAESIEWLIEDQALLRSYHSAPCTPPSPLSPVSNLSHCLSRPVCRRRALMGEGEEGVGGETNHTTARKQGPL